LNHCEHHTKFPQRRAFLRENAFLSVLREAAGKTAGKSMPRNGKIRGRLREKREVADVMICSIRFKWPVGRAFTGGAQCARRRAEMTTSAERCESTLIRPAA
jgi:hypothetical protein